jgi:hypothetical protein
MQELVVQNQLPGATMGPWSESHEASLFSCSGTEGAHSQASSKLPQPSQFVSPNVPGPIEDVFFVYRQLRCDCQESAFASLKSLADRVHERPTVDTVIDSPESTGHHGPRGSPSSPPGADRPFEVVTDPDPVNDSAQQDAGISSLALEALEGSLSACARLMSVRVKAGGLRPLALHRCLLPLAEAGVLRARLELFVQHHDTLVHEGSSVDATQAAFSRGVHIVLRMHRVLLRTCIASILARRATEAASADSHVESTPVTAVEILQHTRSLREQVPLPCMLHASLMHCATVRNAWDVTVVAAAVQCCAACSLWRAAAGAELRAMMKIGLAMCDAHACCAGGISGGLMLVSS